MFLVHLVKILVLDDFYSFLDFWFFHLPQKIFRKTLDFIYSIDADIKIKSHFKNFFTPFYGEKSFILLLVSIPFRTLIIILGSLFYSIIIISSLVLILILTLTPIIFFLIFLNILNHGVLLRK